MRLLFVTPYYYPELKFGGPPQKIHAIARGLMSRGHHIRVITFNHEGGSATAELQIDGVPVQYLRWRGRGLRQLPLDRRVLRREIEQTDLVHCYGLYTALVPIASRIASKNSIPVVQEPLGMYPPRARNRFAKRIYNALITRRLLQNAAAVIAASESEAAALRAFVASAKIFYRRNGIDIAAFARLPLGAELRKRWNIGQHNSAIVFIGRLSPIKNLEQLVCAFANTDFANARLVLVGPGEPDYEKRLRKLVRQHGMGDRVIFADALYGDDQKAALAAADLVVLPSLNESFGNAAAEAVAANVPVLLTNTCGVAPIIHKRAGLAVPLGTESITEGLRIMLDPVHREQFLLLREEVKRDLSWDEPIRQTEEIYRNILTMRRQDDGTTG